MPKTIQANASPEKRLFISLLTRDISLIDAFLDLVDNSINSAIKKKKIDLRRTEDYVKLFEGNADDKAPEINITILNDSIEIRDTTGGISLKDAENDVFRFGADDKERSGDRLSVYGIGLKRAIFKMGNIIDIKSHHPNGGFTLDLDVAAWARKKEQQWKIDISPYSVSSGKYGTTIKISELSADVNTRIKDATFETELINRLSETYVYFLDRLIRITVNSKKVKPVRLKIGSNFASDKLSEYKVHCNITAGIAYPRGDTFLAETSGWFIFCNGRAVAFADKSELTGWGVTGLLPSFQPKHRPFIGLVFFASSDPSLLPWTTTKAAINQESLLWQIAKRRMATLARDIVQVLDRRYSDVGTEITPEILRQVSGPSSVSLFSATTRSRSFKSPPAPKKVARLTTSIQYSVRISDLTKVKEHIGKRSMSNSDIGKYTFNYFIKNAM